MTPEPRERWVIRNLVVLLTVVLIAGGFVGGVAFKRYVNSRIHEEAVKAAQLQVKALNYSLNHTACAIRKIVAPQLASLSRAEKDKHLPLSSRKRAAATYAKTQQALIIWTTVPVDFDCSTLPKTPPQVK